MTVLSFTLLVWTISLLAGFLGALTGLGGGVVLVPTLALAFGVDIRYAIGASLVSVIATTLGATAGAFAATHVSTQTIAVIFGLVLIYSAYQSFFEPEGDVRESLT